MRTYFFLLVLWPVLSLAQLPTSAPTIPLQDGKGTSGPGWINIEEEATTKLGADTQETSNTPQLRGLDKDVATLGLSSKIDTKIGGVIPLQFNAAMQTRLKNQQKDTGSSAFGLEGDFISTAVGAELSATKRLKLSSTVQAEQAKFDNSLLQQRNVLSPELKLSYQLTKRLRLHLTQGQSTQQLTSALANTGDLPPTKTHTTNIGGEYRGRFLFLRVNTFHYEISGVTEALDIGEGQGVRLLSAGDGFTSGMETEQRFTIKNFSLWSKQLILISRINDGDAERRMNGLPFFVGSGGLRYANEKTSASASATFAGSRQQSGLDEPAELLIDLSMRRKISDDAFWYVSAENLTNETKTLSTFQLNSGAPAQELATTGRTFFTGFILQFKEKHDH